MTETTIGERIHEYIRDELLAGDDADLTPTTPLLELGILNSFALLGLVARLNGLYGIGLKPDEITGQDFKTIESISRLVASRLPVGPAQAFEVDRVGVDGPAVFEAPACAQLFVLFTGLGRHLNGRYIANWPVSRFFMESSLTDRNIIVFGDPHGVSYRRGVSDALPTPTNVFEWLRQWIDARTHIDEVYCIGVSAGGPIAMMAGEYLRAQTVWALGPRPVRAAFADSDSMLLRTVEEGTGKTLAQLEQELTDGDSEKIDAICTPQMVERYHASFLDPAAVLDDTHLAELADALSHPNRVTQHRLLYCPRDVCDAHVADRLRSCPTVTTVELRPTKAPPRPWVFSRWIPPIDWLMRDHLVVDILLRRRQLATLFPRFRPAHGSERGMAAPSVSA